MDAHIGFAKALRGLFLRRWSAISHFVAGSARKPCAPEFQNHLICGNVPARLIVLYQAGPALATRRWSSKAMFMRSGDSRDSICGCPFSGVSSLSRKPLSPKHRSTFLPLQHHATLTSSVDWGLTGCKALHPGVHFSCALQKSGMLLSRLNRLHPILKAYVVTVFLHQGMEWLSQP